MDSKITKLVDEEVKNTKYVCSECGADAIFYEGEENDEEDDDYEGESEFGWKLICYHPKQIKDRGGKINNNKCWDSNKKGSLI
jgi:hypothetical protein